LGRRLAHVVLIPRLSLARTLERTRRGIKPGRLDLLNGSLGGASHNDGRRRTHGHEPPGFGPPAERAPEAVREDVRNGYVSADAAADVYRQPQDEQ
jgi:hypothetical protein